MYAGAFVDVEGGAVGAMDVASGGGAGLRPNRVPIAGPAGAGTVGTGFSSSSASARGVALRKLNLSGGLPMLEGVPRAGDRDGACSGAEKKDVETGAGTRARDASDGSAGAPLLAATTQTDNRV